MAKTVKTKSRKRSRSEEEKVEKDTKLTESPVKAKKVTETERKEIVEKKTNKTNEKKAPKRNSRRLSRREKRLVDLKEANKLTWDKDVETKKAPEPAQKEEEKETKETPEETEKPQKKQKNRWRDQMTVVVKHIDYDCGEQEIKNFFTFKGCKVIKMKLVRNKFDEFIGMAFVTFGDKQSFDKAMTLDKKIMGTKPVTLEVALHQREKKNMKAAVGKIIASKNVFPRTKTFSLKRHIEETVANNSKGLKTTDFDTKVNSFLAGVPETVRHAALQEIASTDFSTIRGKPSAFIMGTVRKHLRSSKLSGVRKQHSESAKTNSKKDSTAEETSEVALPRNIGDKTEAKKMSAKERFEAARAKMGADDDEE
eukprot:TRINITY_DN3719_c0_g1_i2.p1 TRINITY_DN3719_c0_g1~~TRINITY_DN3719_c0_g1_i2.p1  ORF type:complete len:379 (-),score=140.78 TRINITY_DN3719_c0_g1_i2:95-1195(-)